MALSLDEALARWRAGKGHREPVPHRASSWREAKFKSGGTPIKKRSVATPTKKRSVGRPQLPAEVHAARWPCRWCLKPGIRGHWYCSTKCRRAASSARAKWHCVRCGAPNPHGKSQPHCSTACRQAAHRDRFPLPGPVTCGTCGVVFTGARDQRYCSVKCAGDQGGRPRTRQCVVCGKYPDGRSRKSRYCSAECCATAVAARAAAIRASRPVKPPRGICLTCGAVARGVSGVMCVACLKAKIKNGWARRRTGALQPQQRPFIVPRPCFWCERPFTSISKGRRLCSRGCAAHWSRVRRRHGLSYETPRDVVQAYRLLGLLSYSMQSQEARAEVQRRLDGG